MRHASRWCCGIPGVLFSGLLAVTMPWLAGCHEPLLPAAGVPQALAPDQYLAQLVVAPGPAADTYRVRVTLSGGAAAPRMGGFRARLVLPAALAAVGEVADQAGAEGALMRVVRLDGADVHAVGAAAEGLAMGDLFVVTVRGGADALRQLRLEVEELVDVRGTDRRARTVVAPRVDDSRVRR
ncbi:MAG: hypothetical protein RLZ32_1620 [Gemmatimonadota bacterium]|jgi:hypothetical protein